MEVRFDVYCESYAILSAKNTFVKKPTASGNAPFAVLQDLRIEIYVLGASCECQTLSTLCLCLNNLITSCPAAPTAACLRNLVLLPETQCPFVDCTVYILVALSTELS